MEIKAKLNKPYTSKQRADFIVENNHQQGYEIQETEEALFAIQPDPYILTKEEVCQIREALYRDQKDPITCQIQSLRDEEETEEILAEIEALKVKRAEVVAKIKEENPYPEEK